MDFLSSEMDPFMKMFAFYSAQTPGTYFNLRGLKTAAEEYIIRTAPYQKLK